MNGGISPLWSALGQFSGTQVAWPGNCFEPSQERYNCRISCATHRGQFAGPTD
jgi:hypothetical protein